MIRRMVGAVVMMLALTPGAGAADNPVSPDSGDQIIQPQIDRRDVSVPKIPSKDYELSLFIGQYNAEAFGVRPVYGVRAGYHLSEDFFVEFTLGRSTITDENFRVSGRAVFTEDVTPLLYYNLSVGLNVLPGELFLGQGRAWRTSLYLVGGVGSTSFDIYDRITLSLGAGLRVLPSNKMSFRMELREHAYESDILGTNKFLRNLELTGGVSMYF